MKQETARNTNWLYRIALIASLAGALWLIYYALANSEAPFSWYAVPAMLLFIVPFLACTIIGWEWPLTGGLLFILIGCLWPANSLAIGLQGLTLLRIVKSTLPISLPFLASGILFLLSRRGHGVSQDKNRRMPRLHLAGLLIIAFTGIFSFVDEITFRLDMQFGVISTLMTALLISSGLFLLAVASWAQPRWGGIIGVGYSLLMIAFFLITQVEDRTLLQTLLDLRYDFIITILVFIGSIMVLVSASWRSGSVSVAL